MLQGGWQCGRGITLRGRERPFTQTTRHEARQPGPHRGRTARTTRATERSEPLGTGRPPPQPSTQPLEPASTACLLALVEIRARRSHQAAAARHPCCDEDREGGQASSSLPPAGGGGARLLGGLMHQAGAAAWASEPDRSGGSSRHPTPYRCPTSDLAIGSTLSRCAKVATYTQAVVVPRQAAVGPEALADLVARLASSAGRKPHLGAMAYVGG
jgi:hypothetical protein